MKKFIVLLQKEIKELLTLQMLLPMLITMVVFILIGNVVGGEQKKAAQAVQNIAVLDLDHTDTSRAMLDFLAKTNYKVDLYTGQAIATVIKDAKNKNSSDLLVIPQGFAEGIQAFKPQQIAAYSIIKNFSIMGVATGSRYRNAIASINEYLSNQLITQKTTGANPEDLKNPIKTDNFVVIGDKTAHISPDAVTGVIMSQTIMLPVVMFIVILLASQMIAVAIASEKENKTLETLLSTPVSRVALVCAKMAAAGIISLLTAVVYMFAFRQYINGVSGGAMSQAAANSQVTEAIKQLGLSFNISSYVLLGASLFLSIMIALSISIILGAFAQDVKSAQGLIAPIMFLIMIPYFLVMFIDLNTAAPLVKYLVFAIPFSHPFLAGPYIFAHNYPPIFYGLIYEAIVFLVFVLIAVRIFSTDRILTMKLNFKRKGF